MKIVKHIIEHAALGLPPDAGQRLDIVEKQLSQVASAPKGGGGGGGGTNLEVQDNGTSVDTATATINIKGAGVTTSKVGKTVEVNIPGGGGGGGSEVNSGVVDGVTTETLPVFFNEDQQALKIFYLGNWITLAQVSFDSLWDSLTDEWDSATMTWDSPLA